MRGSSRGSARRLGWGLADQALSSLSNFGVGIMVARSVSPREFGVFALAFSLYTVVVGIARAIATDALVVRFSAATGREAVDARRRATGLALRIGLIAGLVLVVLAFVGGPEFRPLLLALGISMPGLTLQDAWRTVFFAAGRGVQALVNDAVWTALIVPGFLFCEASDRVSAGSLVLAWGGAATVAALLGAIQTASLPDLRGSISWLRENRHLWPRYLAESLAVTGTVQVYFLVIGAIGGLVAVGQIKLVQVALGPVNVVIQGVGLVAIPEAVRAMNSSKRRLDFVVVAISLLIASGALAWGALLAFTPRGWTTAVVGSGWVGAASLVLPLSLLQIVNGANTGAFVGLRAFRAAKCSLRIRLFSSVSFLIGAVVGVSFGGAHGAAYGLAAASAVNLVAWWRQYTIERRGYYRARNGRATKTPVAFSAASQPPVTYDRPVTYGEA